MPRHVLSRINFWIFFNIQKKKKFYCSEPRCWRYTRLLFLTRIANSVCRQNIIIVKFRVMMIIVNNNFSKSLRKSTSSSMFSWADLKRSNANISESASRDLCPQLSSDSECFPTPPNTTRTSNPSKKLPPSGGSSFAIVLGNRVEN